MSEEKDTKELKCKECPYTSTREDRCLFNAEEEIGATALCNYPQDACLTIIIGKHISAFTLRKAINK